VRDRALVEIANQLVKGRVWFEEPQRHARMLWEGLFYMFWHADKSVYQRDVSLKIAKIVNELSTKTDCWNEKQK
jgi:hypothetical protein